MTADTTTDPVTAELAAIRERQETGDLREFAHKDSPRLLAALKAVLEYHQPRPLTAQECISWKPERQPVLVCIGCRDDAGETVEWPCPEYADISATLLGQEQGGE